MNTKKNFIYNLVYQLLVMILPLMTTPYIARVIGPEGVGMQSYTYSIVSYFVLFIMLGINNHGNRSVAMVRDDKNKLNETFWGIYYIQISMSAIIVILYGVYILFAVDKYKELFLVQYIYILAAALDINWLFFGLEKFKFTVSRNIIIKIISVFSIFLFIKNKDDLIIYSLILAIGTLVSQLVLWKYAFKEIKFNKPDIKNIKENIKPILILFIPIIAISIYKIMDKIMIGSMSDIMQLGYYENSEKIINIPLGIITALATVMLPKMSNLYANGKEVEGKKYIGISIEFVMIMSIGSVFGLIGVSEVFIPIFLGEKFNGCINVVSMLSITILFIAWANVIRTQYLIPKKEDKIYLYSTIFGAVINLILNIIFIPKIGAVGASIGTILAEGTVCIYQTLKVRKYLDIKGYFKKNIFYLLPGIIMCVIVRLIGDTLDRTLTTGVIQIALGIILYCTISFIYLIKIDSDLVKSIKLSKLNSFTSLLD